MAGIYIHIPFCHKACTYCDFHFSTNFTLREPLVDAIVKEITLQTEFWSRYAFTTVYFGGGTPSAIPTEDIQRIMDHLRSHYDLSSLKECTLESNPEDITADHLSAWHEAGINRISMGIQSFQERDLAFMNRNHDSSQAHKALQLMVDSKINAVNADLIYGTPGLSDEELTDNINQLLRYPIQHISAYALTVEDKTALAHQVKNKLVKGPDEDQVVRQYMLTHNALDKAGYDHYEISNYGIRGHHALHNSNYWNYKPYLGLGPGAHSYAKAIRMYNVSNNKKYIDVINQGGIPAQFEKLELDQQYNEFILVQFRRATGISKNSIAQFSEKQQEHFYTTAENLLYLEHICASPTHYYLNAEQMLHADGIAEKFMVV